MLHCSVSGLTKQNMTPQYLCVKKPLKMANGRRNGVVHVTSQKIHGDKQNNFVTSFFILAKGAEKVATANPFVSKEQRRK